MQLEFITVDVFTEQRFGGNPLAVILDGRGVTTAQMQAIAAEFNLAETTFVLPPRDAAHTAEVRIFTPRSEIAVRRPPQCRYRLSCWRARPKAKAGPVGDPLFFEEKAGLVRLDVLRDGAAAGRRTT